MNSDVVAIASVGSRKKGWRSYDASADHEVRRNLLLLKQIVIQNHRRRVRAIIERKRNYASGDIDNWKLFALGYVETIASSYLTIVFGVTAERRRANCGAPGVRARIPRPCSCDRDVSRDKACFHCVIESCDPCGR